MHDLGDNAHAGQARREGEFHCGFGVAGALRHAAVNGAQREDVAGAGNIRRSGGSVREDLHGACAICRGDAGAHTRCRIAGDGVCSALGVLVVGDHGRQVHLVGTLVAQGCADHAGGVADHEAHQLGGCVLGGEDDVTFVFAVFVVNDDYGATCCDSVHCGLHAVEDACGVGATRRNLLTGVRRVSLGHACERGQTLHVLSERIGLKVHAVADLEGTEVGCLQGFGNQTDLEPCGGFTGLRNGGDGQGHARNSDGALLSEQGCQFGGQVETQGAPRLVRGDGCEGTDRIHVALHDVTVEAATGGQAALQVDGVAGVQVAEVGAAQSLTHRVGAELAGLQLVEVDSGEAYTVDGEGSAVFEVGDNVTGVEGQIGCVATFDGGDGFYGAEGANDSGKHVCFPFLAVSAGASSLRATGGDGLFVGITIRIFRIFPVTGSFCASMRTSRHKLAGRRRGFLEVLLPPPALNPGGC